MNKMEIQNIKSHFTNVLNYYENLKKKFIEVGNELESLSLHLVELKNKISNLNMQSSILYYFDVKQTLSELEKEIFDLDALNQDEEQEIITPNIRKIELILKEKNAEILALDVSDIQKRLMSVNYKLKNNKGILVEEKNSLNAHEKVIFSTNLVAGIYLVEGEFSYKSLNTIEKFIKISNEVTVEEEIIPPVPPVEPPVLPEGTDKIATLKITSSQSWGTGFSAKMELISHTTENFGQDWELKFESPATSFSQWQIISTMTQDGKIVITTGKDWSGAGNFVLGPLGSFVIDGVNGNGAPFDKNIVKNATLNGKAINIQINGVSVEEGDTILPNPNVIFPEDISLINAIDVESIYLSKDKKQILGTITILNVDIYKEFAIYVNGFKTLIKKVEFFRKSTLLNICIEISELYLSEGTNTVELIFAGYDKSTTIFYKSNKIEIIGENKPNSKGKSLIGYWSAWGGNGPTSYIDLEAVPKEYDTIVVSFIEHSNDFLTPRFDPEESKQVTKEEFKQKVRNMKAKGHNVIIAVGGQNGVFKLNSDNAREVFKNGVIRIIEEYGFNGFDVDLEGQSAQGGTFHIVRAIKEIIEYFRKKDPKFIYSMAPEVAYLICTGFGTLYIDLIRETKHLITTIHPQYYNAPGTGVYSFDGSGTLIDCKNQARFIPEFTEALIKGHDGPAWGAAYAQLFPIGPIPQEMLAIGLPAGVGAAGTGAINDMEVFKNAWIEIQRKGYTNVKGFMTWSIDWDQYHNWQFKNTVSKLIK